MPSQRMGQLAPTTLTATSTTTNVESDGTAVAGTPVTTSRDYSDNGVAVVNSWTPSGDSIYTPGGSTGYDLNVNVVSNSLDVDYAAYANLSTTSAGVMLSDSGAAAQAFEAANPLTVVVIAPENTTLASDADIVDALMNANAGGSIATSADKITITHLADYDGQEAIAISGLDNYLADSQITIPLTVDADATAGTTIASSDTVFVEPSSALISVDGTTLTSLGSVEADYAAGNLYNVTDTPDQIIGTVEASQTVAASDAVQGSADAAAQLTTGTINADDDTATGKTMLYNGSDADVTGSSTTVNLASDGTQVISLTGAPTITSSDGSTITTATITYDTSTGTTTTDPTQAASFTVTNLPVSTGETVTISYPMTVDSTVLAGTTTGIQWPYTTAVQFYSDGTLAAGDATALGTETDTTMNLQAVHNLTDIWYLATQDSDGNYVAGEEVGTYAGTTGTTYSASNVTNLAVGDTASNGDVVVGYYDESAGTMVTDPTALTMVENETADG
ncbi:hypothetical protein [Secundilactobacillus paracollinoides]|uniref:hypothetical protein n=1 Tax=Secundilactobacillus paracollinoides TaxID=240427 RepID=UPI0012E32DF9|nr:hypothetical protein [Secundilactobacillus paracollinoides]